MKIELNDDQRQLSVPLSEGSALLILPASVTHGDLNEVVAMVQWWKEHRVESFRVQAGLAK